MKKVLWPFPVRNGKPVKPETVKPKPEQKRPPNCGTGYCSCIECLVGKAPW